MSAVHYVCCSPLVDSKDSVDRCFIPGGFDSKELISISTGVAESTLDLGNVRFEFETRYPPAGILPIVEVGFFFNVC